MANHLPPVSPRCYSALSELEDEHAERPRIALAIAAAAPTALRGGTAPGPVFMSLDRRLQGAPARLTSRAVDKPFAELAREAGGAQVRRPHGIYDTAVTRALEDGVPVQAVAIYVRNVRVRTLLDEHTNMIVDVGGEVAARMAAHV